MESGEWERSPDLGDQRKFREREMFELNLQKMFHSLGRMKLEEDDRAPSETQLN